MSVFYCSLKFAVGVQFGDFGVHLADSICKAVAVVLRASNKNLYRCGRNVSIAHYRLIKTLPIDNIDMPPLAN